MTTNEVDFNKFRKPYELPHHWQIRQDFLRLHWGKFEEDRLICLSNLFINTQCMGLSYPDDVMNEINELGKNIDSLQNYKHQVYALESEMNDQKEQEEEDFKQRKSNSFQPYNQHYQHQRQQQYRNINRNNNRNQ